MDEQMEKLNRLALDVLILSRNTLLVNLRFLDMAISRLKYHPIEDNTLLTDGEHLLYAPSGLSLQFAPAVAEYKKLIGVNLAEYGLGNTFAN